jgi:DSF synthase
MSHSIPIRKASGAICGQKALRASRQAWSCELKVLHRSIQALVASQGPDEEPMVRYYVLASQIPGIFNVGGDLSFFVNKIRARDRQALRRYAYDCVDPIYNVAAGFDSGIVSVGLLQGDALGGGLEAALCCHFIIAERGVKMGLPEILFNSFPGMGAYSMLSRRLDSVRAERMIFSGRIYSAEEMYDLGVIDLVVNKGCGEQAVREYIGDSRKHGARQAIYGAGQRARVCWDSGFSFELGCDSSFGWTDSF